MQTGSIAEKVKFWEEQDRINQALIPRVLKMHEIVTEISAQQGRLSEGTTGIQGQVTKLTTRHQKFGHDLAALEVRLAASVAQVESELSALRADMKSTQISLDGIAKRTNIAIRRPEALVDETSGGTVPGRARPGIFLGAIGAAAGCIALVLQLLGA